ncbi:polyamine aminopropyltransferase 1 [Betaproteobacteria bacterium]|nr:polyamine aminopropyltransferase 1 [Betaproteobacteria bacterium]GHU46829.1 polyamine aminopropyltransferase 1 [Betaproteobacteria bacterium]
MQHALLASVFIIASCGLAYELVAAALASYLLGDSITQFSTIIGAYLFAMGVGSWLSRYVGGNLVRRFIQIELAVGVVGGFTAVALFLAFAAQMGPFRGLLYLAVLAVGVLVGLEIPLVMRILKRDVTFKELVSQVLAVDYLGALAVSLLFPLLFVPYLGLMRTGLLFGLLNVGVAIWALALFRTELARTFGLRLVAGGCLVLLLGGLAIAGKVSSMAESWLYADEVIYTESTPYQRIVITRWHDDIRLFLNQNLQFSSQDEYRYHEALVHPGLAALPQARRILVLGGGDGFAVREILRYPQIQSVTLVDLDPAMTRMFSSVPLLTGLNGNALNDRRVTIINDDAGRWLEENADVFDFVVVDFPDPSSFALGKLYSTGFYRLLTRHLAPDGRLVVQSTSPYYARRSFWTIAVTLEAAGLKTAPYHALVPSFGEWGYVLAGQDEPALPTTYPKGLRFLTVASTPDLFHFPADMARLPVEPNRLNEQSLVRIFEQEWHGVVR